MGFHVLFQSCFYTTWKSSSTDPDGVIFSGLLLLPSLHLFGLIHVHRPFSHSVYRSSVSRVSMRDIDKPFLSVRLSVRPMLVLHRYGCMNLQTFLPLVNPSL